MSADVKINLHRFAENFGDDIKVLACVGIAKEGTYRHYVEMRGQPISRSEATGHDL